MTLVQRKWLVASGGHVPVAVVFPLDVQFSNLLRHRLLTFVKKPKKQILTKGSAQIAAENAKSKHFAQIGLPSYIISLDYNESRLTIFAMLQMQAIQ